MTTIQSAATDSLNAILTHREDLNDELAVVRIAHEGRNVPDFKPGQFVTLGLPKEVKSGEAERLRLLRRAYSISSGATEKGYLEFLVTRIIDGAFTPEFWTYEVGDRIWMDHRIHGEFTLDPVAPDKNLVFVSTGTGVAPFVSMIRTFRNSGRWRRAVLLNGVRRIGDLGYRPDLTDLAREDATFRYIPLVSREPENAAWTGDRGRVQGILLSSDEAAGAKSFEAHSGFALDPANCHVFLCGNPAMIRDVSAQLVARGFSPHSRKNPGNIHTERYW